MTAPIFALAIKDLRLMLRNKGALFFAFGWPLIMALLFGAISSGGGGAHGIPVVAVDDDHSAGSRAFVERLEKADELAVEEHPFAEAQELVRKGKKVAWIRLPPGFGAASDRMFWGDPETIELGIDPSRQTEAGLLEGVVTRYAYEGFQKLFSDPSVGRKSAHDALESLRSSTAQGSPEDRAATEHFLGELETFLDHEEQAATTTKTDAGTKEDGGGWQPIRVERSDVAVAHEGPRSAFEVTVPQGMLWALLGCAAIFGIGLVRERENGTLERIRMSPLSPGHILAGRALSAFLGLLVVQAVLLAIGFGLGVRPGSWPLLAVSVVASAIAFVGLTMLFSVLGKTVESASGLVWALNILMAMFGGGMIPLIAMPGWMRAASGVSPAKWAVLAYEGAIWRGFGPAEMLQPIAILLAVGVVAFAIGTRAFRR